MRASEDALNNEVKIAFSHGNLRWKPCHLRSAYGAICAGFLTEEYDFGSQGCRFRALPGAMDRRAAPVRRRRPVSPLEIIPGSESLGALLGALPDP